MKKMAKKIFIAENNVAIQKLFQKILPSDEYELIFESKGINSVEKVKELKPDLVIANISIPDKSGYEICEEIKKDPEIKNIPVLLTEGIFEDIELEESVRVNANGFISRPFEATAILEKVKEIVEKQAESSFEETLDLEEVTDVSDLTLSDFGNDKEEEVIDLVDVVEAEEKGEKDLLKEIEEDTMVVDMDEILGRKLAGDTKELVEEEDIFKEEEVSKEEVVSPESPKEGILEEKVSEAKEEKIDLEELELKTEELKEEEKLFEDMPEEETVSEMGFEKPLELGEEDAFELNLEEEKEKSKEEFDIEFQDLEKRETHVEDIKELEEKITSSEIGLEKETDKKEGLKEIEQAEEDLSELIEEFGKTIELEEEPRLENIDLAAQKEKTFQPELDKEIEELGLEKDEPLDIDKFKDLELKEETISEEGEQKPKEDRAKGETIEAIESFEEKIIEDLDEFRPITSFEEISPTMLETKSDEELSNELKEVSKSIEQIIEKPESDLDREVVSQDEEIEETPFDLEKEEALIKEVETREKEEGIEELKVSSEIENKVTKLMTEYLQKFLNENVPQIVNSFAEIISNQVEIACDKIVPKLTEKYVKEAIEKIQKL